jgi:N-acetylglucosamine-6-phosphate deacetylase
MEESLRAYNTVKKEKRKGYSNLLGIHMEGPYFAVSQRGAQDISYFGDIAKKHYVAFFDICKDIKRWSAAPETDVSGEFAVFCRKNSILLSIAHSDAAYLEVEKAHKQGYRMFTHLYSGMTGVTRKNGFRVGGAVEAAFLFEDMYTETIADLKHLPEELIRLVFKIKGSSRNILITDAMRAAGQQKGESILGSLKNGQRVLIEDGVAKLSDKSAFAGSIATANTLVKNTISCGISLYDAVKMITETPAKILDRKDIGVIAPGKRADLVIFDENINVKRIIKDGMLLENE